MARGTEFIGRISLTRSFLLNIRPLDRPRINSGLFETLRSLKILKNCRTKRCGKLNKLDSCNLHTITTVTSQRTKSSCTFLNNSKKTARWLININTQNESIYSNNLTERTLEIISTRNHSRDGENLPRDLHTSRSMFPKKSTRQKNNLIVIQPTNSYANLPRLNCSLSLWNARSIRNKSSTVIDMVISNKLDILALTETWLCGNQKDNITISAVLNSLTDHVFIHSPRMSGKGGGLGLLCKKGFNPQRILDNIKFPSFDHLVVFLSSGPELVQLVLIYRPPPSKKNTLTVTSFLAEFGSLLEQVVISPGKLLITGDFNFHVDTLSDSNSTKFVDLLESFSLKQLVHVPTHKSGHTLDLVIRRSHEDFISDISASFEFPSDHAAINSCLHVPKPKPTRCLIKFRKLREVNLEAFKSDVSISSLITRPAADVNTLTEDYNSTLLNLLNIHAPEITRQITTRPHAPWFSDTLRDAKREKRSAERRWKLTGLTIHQQMFKQQCKLYQDLLDAEKNNYHTKKFSDCDQSQLFKLVDRMVNGKSNKVLPSSDDDKNLPELFSTYFSKKVTSLRATLDACHIPFVPLTDDNVAMISELSHFTPLSVEDTRRLIMKSSSKTCALDPAPSALVKDCLDVLVPTITDIFNKSLSSGTVPTSFKSALVTPILKKPSLDHNLLSSYRPVSNLPFLSKVLERAVLEQLHRHLSQNKLYTKFQSAYRKFHSTETALVRVYNDLLTTIDKGNEVILVLLDLTAAFDTIDHTILLNRLRSKFGISHLALKWFEDYLALRNQTVAIDSHSSSCSPLTYGVPQGSVLGPVLFTLYFSPIEEVVASHGLGSMFYADDSQLYMTVEKPKIQSAITCIEDCVTDVITWCTQNKLALNSSKTETLHIFSKFDRHKQNFPGLSAGDSVICCNNSTVRDLGTTLDSYLNMESHTKNVVKAASYELHKIAKLRPYLTKPCAEKLVHAFISSRLDYCNSLLAGLPDYLINKLQRVQNSAARLLTRSKRHDHITPVLRSLHWLPVHKRIQFKLLLITFKALHSQAPDYITELLHPLNHRPGLRSTTTNMLSVPRTRTSTYGDRAFTVAAPRLWNLLPAKLRTIESLNTFKSEVKTFLFNNCI